jgi:hypothetical protein
MSELQLTSAILLALEQLGAWPMRVNSGQARRGGGVIQLAAIGTPDILLIGPGKVAGSWLEVKTETGRLRPEQIAWHEKARRMGVRVAVVRSVEGAVSTVRRWQIRGRGVTNEELEASMDKLVDELNETSRKLRRVRERVLALIDRERELRARLEGRKESP